MRTLMGHDVLPREALAAVPPVKSVEAGRSMTTSSPVAPAPCCGKPPIAKHAVPKPVFLRGRAAWRGVAARVCQAACGPQPSVSPGTPVACNAGEAFSLRTILMLGKCAYSAPRSRPAGSRVTISGLVVFDIWQAVYILLPDGICPGRPDNSLWSTPHVHWKITAHHGCF